MPRRIVQMCRSSATLVDVVVRSASPTHHLSRSPARTKEAVCKKKPLRGDIQPSFDQAGLEVASGVGGEDEELEWPSNGDASPVLETMEPEPRVKEVARQRQPAAELGQRWCQHCGSMKKPQWRQGAAEEEQERDWLSNKDVPVMETREPKPSVLVRPRRRAVIASSSSPSATADKLGQRRCRHCGTTESRGPEGRHTLCNACGIRIRYRSGGLVPEYRPLGSPTFYPELHSNSAQDALCRRGSSSAASPLTPSHK